MAKPSDVSNLPIRAQIALQRFERLATAHKTRLAVYMKAQPMTVTQSTRHEVVLKQIKDHINAKAALTARIHEHFKELQNLVGPQEEVKPATAASSRKTASAGE